MSIVTNTGDQISADLSNDLEVGEIIQSHEGEMYEIIGIADTNVTVELVQVDEDWGE